MAVSLIVSYGETGIHPTEFRVRLFGTDIKRIRVSIKNLFSDEDKKALKAQLDKLNPEDDDKSLRVSQAIRALFNKYSQNQIRKHIVK